MTHNDSISHIFREEIDDDVVNSLVNEIDSANINPANGVNEIDSANTNPANGVQGDADNNTQGETGDPNCPVCREEVEHNHQGIECDKCETWYHRCCLQMSESTYQEWQESDESWFCMLCLSIKANKIKWGEIEGEENIRKCISDTYNEVTTWRKNLFLLPRGKVGTDFIKEITRLIRLFVDNSKWSRLALALVHIFAPLMLQKPSSKSKARDNAIYLQKRLQLWKDGKIKDLIDEGKEIQQRLTKNIQKKEENKARAIVRLMLIGKLGPAMKFINNEDQILGIHPLNDTIKELLEQKHPKSREALEEILLHGDTTEPLPVIYEEIDADKVYKAALHLEGSGGPTMLDAEGWKHILCSKSYGKDSGNLCQAIAELAKKLCREEIHPDCLHEFVACRLVPLDKGADKQGNPGVRPIGIGEILRRLVGKVVVGNIREDIIKAAGPLQTCAGLKAGIEASIHAMRSIFEEEMTEVLLLVDAENAFNNLNRRAALHNIKHICPNFHRYISNTYQLSAQMMIRDEKGQNDCIFSDEGSTQGDVTAMAMYAIATRPLVDRLGEVVNPRLCKQVWYADDSAAAGKTTEVRKWWDELNSVGPKYGYYPKACKTILIVKNPALLEHAIAVFDGTDITIAVEGERHLGAVIGSTSFKEKYVEKKVKKWVEDVEEISVIAKTEPQIALSAYTKALCMRWCFVQ